MSFKLPDRLDIVAVELGYPMTSPFQSRSKDISQEHIQQVDEETVLIPWREAPR